MGLFDFLKNKKVKKKNNEELFLDGIDKNFEDFFEKFNNRLIYKELSKEIIDSTLDEELEQLIFDNINTIEDRSLLSKGQKAILSTYIVQGEVSNGGFNQFYFNAKDEYSDMAIEGFSTLGVNDFVVLMAKANKIYKVIKKDLEKNNNGSWESFSNSYHDNPLNNLDTTFYKLDEKLNLRAIKINYIRENISEFIK